MAKNKKPLTELQKAERVLSAIGRPVGHAGGLYRKQLPQLAALWDEPDESPHPGARSKWLEIHEQAMGEHKATDPDTDATTDTQD